MSVEFLPRFLTDHYEVHEWRHACAVLRHDFPSEWSELIAVLTDFRLPRSFIAEGGGNKSKVARSLDGAFAAHGWTEKEFNTQVVVDGTGRDNPTHHIDCYKNKVALEIEWNNKDPFFDRDLNNFRILFDLHAISVGIIVTRCDELQTIFNEMGRGKSYGQNTTHMGQLLPRVQGGGGGGCPILVFGITRKLYVPGA